MIEIGQAAPGFEAVGADGQAITLAGLLAAGPLILYFYPKDHTSVCTRQACMLRDEISAFAGSGVQVVGVSPQGAESHARFRAQQRLDFLLLSDPERRIARAYGALGPFGMIRRDTYFIDAEGIVRDRVRADFRVGRHLELVRRVASLQGKRQN